MHIWYVHFQCHGLPFQVTGHAAHIRCGWWWLGRIAGRGVKTQAMAWRGGVARSPIRAWHLGFWVSWPLGICECRMVWGRGGAKTSTSRYQSEICDSLHLGDANVHFSVFVWGLHCYYFTDTCIWHWERRNQIVHVPAYWEFVLPRLAAFLPRYGCGTHHWLFSFEHASQHP